MIKDDTRQTLKFIAWVAGTIIFLYFLAVAVFYFAGDQYRNDIHQTEQLALAKSPIIKVEKRYHLDRGVNSYAVKGRDKAGESYYFIYLPTSKKAYLCDASDGVSAGSVAFTYSQFYPHRKIEKINLGWDHGQAVWEITAQDKDGNYYYTLYKFKNGNKLS
ncbi:hypothetical protein PT285_05835 [Lactobacillus sp. ESL0791]|uniref:hypothetical protein n=1 Tax=Lactobacillus sp. ESL0791 TaxID=2983234 RepID=UPI0023F69544|nr:hypothetical protein [Lactobacillus sp. ESL0791]MDF7638918.1 hypothetical protein [Lactobacillus sp. ESL0791]